MAPRYYVKHTIEAIHCQEYNEKMPDEKLGEPQKFVRHFSLCGLHKEEYYGSFLTFKFI